MFVQWGVGDGSWRGAVREYQMVGSVVCQLPKVWDGGVRVRTGYCLSCFWRRNCQWVARIDLVDWALLRFFEVVEQTSCGPRIHMAVI